MKTKAMLIKLFENPDKKFVSNKGLPTELIASIDCGHLVVKDFRGEIYRSNVSLDRDWTSINEEVTWQEAIQYWIDGKGGFEIHHKGDVFTQPSLYRLGMFKDAQYDGFPLNFFKDGKFYLI